MGDEGSRWRWRRSRDRSVLEIDFVSECLNCLDKRQRKWGNSPLEINWFQSFAGVGCGVGDSLFLEAAVVESSRRVCACRPIVRIGGRNRQDGDVRERDQEEEGGDSVLLWMKRRMCADMVAGWGRDKARIVLVYLVD